MTTKKKILIIDDDTDFLQSSKQLLETADYEVYVSSNSRDGIESAKKIQPNLILLDVMMESETESFEVNRKIKSTSETENIPVVMLTGINKSGKFSHRFDTDKGWPCEALLDKPVPPEQLLMKVKQLAS